MAVIMVSAAAVVVVLADEVVRYPLAAAISGLCHFQ
jgi:hypothetical protein